MNSHHLPLRPHRFEGGIHPADGKAYTTDGTIRIPPLLEKYQVVIQQNIGVSPLLKVKKGDTVKKGQQIALWGMRLSFAHPISKEQMLFIAPTPEEKPWLFFERELKGLETVWPQIKPVMVRE